jgi:glyoxylase-like metal-dependent hydrolase (beta-lactamase superfamily II)
MSERISPATLSYDTFISQPIPVATDDLVPNGDRRMFSPMTATLIMGAEEAVLVDPPMTIEQTRLVGDWIEKSGRTLIHIYLTHGHGDHWFGTGLLLDRFPGATALATPGTIEVMKRNAAPEFRAAVWDAQFPGQIPALIVIASPMVGDVINLEGNELRVIEVGHTDTDETTVLHVPSIGLIVAGDVIYNNVHQYLREAQGEGIESWLTAIDQVEALKPTSIVSGHKDSSLSDDPANIDLTRRYLLDARRLLAQVPTPSARQFFDYMLELYPNRLNPGALWGGATALLS